MSRAQKWSAATAVLALAILVAGWLLLISPKRGEAAELAEMQVSQEQSIELLRARIESLISQDAELPAKKAEIAAIRAQLPDDAALPALIRDLTDAAETAGTTLGSIEPGTPVALLGGAASSTADPAAAAAAGTSMSTAAELVAVPVSIRASGEFFEIEHYFEKLQNLKRIFVVTGFELTNPEADTGGTKLELSLQGRVFAAPTADETPTDAVPAPSAAGGSDSAAPVTTS